MLTFIIPTIGRETLGTTLQSLYDQTCAEWRAILIFDGVACNIDRNLVDSRVKIMEIEKCGQHTNCAGFVRNSGIRECDTEWIAFVDDDDLVSSRYVETFYKEIGEYETDVVIFRMYSDKTSEIYPSLKIDNFYQENVGISFALRRSVFERGIWFQPSDAEDYYLLDRIRGLGYKMMISPFIRYFVRIFNKEIMSDFTDDLITGNRVFIGMNSPR